MVQVARPDHAVVMSAPLVLLVDPRRDFRDAFKLAARGSLRVLAFPDITAALGALDRHHPTAVVASMAQARQQTTGAQLCSAAKETLHEGLFIAYGLDHDGRPLTASSARAAQDECGLDNLLVDDVPASDLVGVVTQSLGIDAAKTARSGTGLVRKLRLAFGGKTAEA